MTINPAALVLQNHLKEMINDYNRLEENIESITQNLSTQKTHLQNKKIAIKSHRESIAILQKHDKKSPDLIEKHNQINKHTDYVQEVAAAMKARSEGVQFLPNIIIIVEDDCQIEETKK